MAKYIHVITATKTPDILSSSWSSPFREYESDPNVDGFGPSERTMFLPVEEIAVPTHNKILQKANGVYTDGVRGEYITGDEVWRFTFTLSDNDLETVRDLKLNALEEAKDAALDAGYSVGNFAFPFTETFFRQLADRHYWLDIAINDGEVPTGTEITFSDRDGKEVSVSLAQLRTNFRQYGSAYLRIFEKEVDARDAIKAALTPAAIDAVTWSF